MFEFAKIKKIADLEREIKKLQNEIISLNDLLNARIQIFEVKEGDTPVILMKGTVGQYKKDFYEAVKSRFPGTTPIILEDGATINFIREKKGVDSDK